MRVKLEERKTCHEDNQNMGKYILKNLEEREHI